jgi:hypothetical protein
MQLRIAVRQIVGRGRGVFASSQFKSGDILWSELPFVAVAAERNICDVCLTPGCQGCTSLADTAENYMNSRLKIGSETEFIGRQKGRLFPILVKRIALKSVILSLQEGSYSETQVASLMHANVTPSMREAWKPDYLRMCRDLHVGSKLVNPLTQEVHQHLTMDWYTKTVTMLNLNAFRVQFHNNAANSHPNADLHSKAGSALYILTSMLNHSCQPNAEIQHAADTGGKVFVKATRDISVDEELTIDYCEEREKQRPSYLHVNYGFTCSECERLSGGGLRCLKR